MNINLMKESLSSIRALVEHIAGPEIARIVTEFSEARHPRKTKEQKANQRRANSKS
jgi:hypothetical protein